MRKRFLFFAAILLFAVSLAGCGNGDTPDNGGEDYTGYMAGYSEDPGASAVEPVEHDNEERLLVGPIVIRDNWLYVDLVEIFMHDEEGFIIAGLSDAALAGVEILTADDHERIAELGLDLSNFHNWHYIRENAGDGPLRFEITDETVFTFIDTGSRFIDDDPEGNPRRVANVGVDDFIIYIAEATWRVPIPPVLNPDNIGADTTARRPYFVTVQGGRVVSVLEEFIFTQ